MDFRKLAEDAAATAYNPRAKRCWLFHSWSMWEYDAGRQEQWRRCTACGRHQIKPISKKRLCNGVGHAWKTDTVVDVYATSESKLPTGKAYYQTCQRCREVRRVLL